MSVLEKDLQTQLADYDVAAIRHDFPVLDQEVHGKPLVYLDNAATSQKPLAVIDRIRDYYLNDNANVHRGVHSLSQRADAAFEAARKTVAGFLNAASEREIIWTRGATEAINLVANTFVQQRVSEGDEILITEMEHHANIVPWQMLCERTGAVLKVAPINDDGELIMNEFEALISERTKFVSVVHVSNALGSINPVERIVELAHARDIPVLIDGAQATPHSVVDVQALDCEFYVFSGHKVYGPSGIGALYGKLAVLEAMPPWQGGGDMILRVSFEGTEYSKVPHKFEAGTPNIEGAIGLAAALDYVSGIGLDRIAAHEHRLLQYATDELSKLDGIRVIGTAHNKAGVVSFVIDGVHPHDIGTIMDQQGVAVRAGHHCAMPVMKHYCVPATARASFGLYNTLEEVDALVGAINKIREIFGNV